MARVLRSNDRKQGSSNSPASGDFSHRKETRMSSEPDSVKSSSVDRADRMMPRGRTSNGPSSPSQPLMNRDEARVQIGEGDNVNGSCPSLSSLWGSHSRLTAETVTATTMSTCSATSSTNTSSPTNQSTSIFTPDRNSTELARSGGNSFDQQVGKATMKKNEKEQQHHSHNKDNTNRQKRRRRRKLQRVPLTPQRRRQILHNQIIFLTYAIITFFILFLFLFLPFSALITLSLLCTTFGLLLYSIYNLALIEYQTVVTRGGGLQQFLPDGIRIQLTQMTLHEWMTDPSFYMEYRYLLLYFIPGLTTEQMENLVRRLPPRHYEMLQRRGLGRLVFGENIMRILEGSSRNNTHAINAQDLGEGSTELADDTYAQRETDGGDVDERDVTVMDTLGGIITMIRSGLDGSSGAPTILEEEVSSRSTADAVSALEASTSPDEDDMVWEENDEEHPEDQSAGAAAVAAEARRTTSAPPLETLTTREPAGSTGDMTRGARRRTYDDSSDEGSDIGLSVTGSDLAGGMNEQQAWSLARFLGLTREGRSTCDNGDNLEENNNGMQQGGGVDTEEEIGRALGITTSSVPTVAAVRAHAETAQDSSRNAPLTVEEQQVVLAEEWNVEGQILSDGISEMIQSYTNTATVALMGVAESLVNAVAPIMIRTGVSVMSISAGVGLYGIWHVRFFAPSSNATSLASSTNISNSSGGGSGGGPAGDAQRTGGVVGRFEHYFTYRTMGWLSGAFVGGAITAGLSAYMRRWIRRTAESYRQGAALMEDDGREKEEGKVSQTKA